MKNFTDLLMMGQNMKRSEIRKTKCLDCGSCMTISKNSYNGHVWIVCEKCGAKIGQ